MKEIMDGYIGVKFEAILLDSEVTFNTDDIYPLFQKNCSLLKRHGMTHQNAGNISIRHNGGLIITTSGSNLGSIERDEIVDARKCSIEDSVVEYMGPNVPSSEAFMHSMIFQCSPNMNAVVHVHDPQTLTRAAAEIDTTEKEVPYGTIELARMACDTFLKADKIIVLKNHGYVAVGIDLNEAVDLVISTHLKIKEKGLDSVSSR
jgi:ribulose-5-phosphate 4-epimerase/fuculose-1-phosphate aldolase